MKAVAIIPARGGSKRISPKYRPDIDGLRAIAVLSIVAFHAFPSWVKGGFIGVDVFFVISGFLISTIIFENLDKGTFRFSEFYARRIKRIFPALLLLLIAVYAFGWFALLPDEYKQLGKHIAAGAGFVSNFAFWTEAGYFDNSAETKPLIHLWSLGIEEQFYIVWPFLLWLAWKNKFNLLTITILVASISFLLNIKEIKEDVVATFYSPQTRFWELLCGSLLAWMILYKNGAYETITAKVDTWLASALYREKPEIEHLIEPYYPTLYPTLAFRDTELEDRKTLSNVLSFVGLFLLAYGFWRINKDISFPGWWAVVPVLGAVLIMLAGPKAWVNRTILSNKIAVWFGLISFPLYLWHWPLLSFARIVEGDLASAHIRLALVSVAILLSWITYRYIERPVRFGTPSSAKIVALSTLMFSGGVLGFVTYEGEGFPWRERELSAKIDNFKGDDPENHSKCMQMYGLSESIRFCRISGDSKPTIAVIGDSHSAALYRGLAAVLRDDGIGLVNLGGRLFLDVATYPLGSQWEIEVYKAGIKTTEFVADERSIDTVIMVSRGPFYLQGDWVFELISDSSIRDRVKVFEIGMRKTLDRYIHKERVIFVLEPPTLNFEPEACIERPVTITGTTKKPCAIPRSQFEAEHKQYRDLVLRVLADYPDVELFDPAAYLCDEELCWAERNGKILYMDEDHLSLDGARVVGQELVRILNGHESNILSNRFVD